MSRDEPVELCLEHLRELMNSHVFSDGDKEYTLPKSQITFIETDGNLWTIEIPAWLAEDRGLV